MAHVLGGAVHTGRPGCALHGGPLVDDARGGELHHRQHPQKGKGLPGGEDEQRRAGEHLLERLVLPLDDAGVGDRGGGESEDRDDDELGEDHRDKQFHEPSRPAARRGPDHGDEREREEEDADVNGCVADDHLEPEYERANREDDRAEEDAEQRDRGVFVEPVLVGVGNGLQQVLGLFGAEA